MRPVVQFEQQSSEPMGVHFCIGTSRVSDKVPSSYVGARRSAQALGIPDMSSHGGAYKDCALHMVGRTVVNFQRLEHNLKLAGRLGPLQGTVQKIQRDIAKRHERASALTLGQAIQAWLDCCRGPLATQYETPDMFDVSVQTTFTLELDSESHAHHAKVLGDLLEVRNDLIHSRLAKFNWEDPEECQGLVADLLQVNSSISMQIEYTCSLLKLIAVLHKDHAESLAAHFASGGAY
jgi:hypothetical protein